MIPETHQDRLLWLAEREAALSPQEQAYANRRGEGWRPTSHYFPHGVPRFPTLRQECAPCFGSGCRENSWPNKERPCETCQGRGWVTVENLKAGLEAIQSLEGLSAQLLISKSGYLVAMDLCENGIYRKIRAHNSKANEAVISALYEAVGGSKELARLEKLEEKDAGQS